MLLNPYRERPATFAGTRILQRALPVLGTTFPDPAEPKRLWTVQGFFAPLPGRVLGGVRAKVVDQKGFVSFANQRDLEVMIGLAQPGEYCRWLGGKYVGPADDEWFGVCSDEEDLRDDLQERELVLRSRAPRGVLQPPLEIARRIHTEPRNDFEEMHVFLWDGDFVTGISPDPRLETIGRRWQRAEMQRVQWERVD